MMKILLLIGFLVWCTEALICTIGQERDPESGGRYRWVIPEPDPCQCTTIRVGGLNTRRPYRPFVVTYMDTFIHSNDQAEIQTWLNCTKKTAETFSDCQALLDAGFKEDGIYTIHPYQNDEGVKVFCDMTKHTGWIVVQRRYSGSVNFNRSWIEYKKGFGSMDGEFWLGNEILHKLTDAEGNWTIRLDITNEQNKTGHLLKTQFHVGPGDYTIFLEHSEIQPSVDIQCGHKLGMEDGSIPDDRITASSQYEFILSAE
ncbi:microfibril-associated glycoprotein 4-like [Asterias rubens]|uniref:microfibril-associated glycoprotein 4-like n=1 Tax=Asterias rubens TaxID=7604 RepID=UPI00145544F8|nr:microfibril-associated glycoprotein 4-like [Asterias rubens]